MYGGGSDILNEQLASSSSYPDGQWGLPSHHNATGMQAFSSGQLSKAKLRYFLGKDKLISSFHYIKKYTYL